jgi:cytosine/adenosine deaminase-related metal-dependent hydrolase
MAETAFEVELSARVYCVPETEFLERIGFLGPDLLAVTAKLVPGDIARCAAMMCASRTTRSAMYLASGVRADRRDGSCRLTIGLATDGPRATT